MSEKILPNRKYKLRPVGERILVRRLPDAERKSEGGVVLPSNVRERSKCGVVIGVGNGRCRDNGQRVAPDVREGDTVIYGAYAGAEVDPMDPNLVALVEFDIIAVVEKEAE